MYIIFLNNRLHVKNIVYLGRATVHGTVLIDNCTNNFKPNQATDIIASKVQFYFESVVSVKKRQFKQLLCQDNRIIIIISD